MARLTRAQKRAANRAAFRAERSGTHVLRGSKKSLYAGQSTMDALTAVQDAWRAGDEVWLEEASARFERITGQAVPHTYRSIPKHLLKRNPRVAFRTCKGKKVAFKAKRRRKGKTPKHLRRYLFKKGHKPKNRCAGRKSRSGRTRRRR